MGRAAMGMVLALLGSLGCAPEQGQTLVPGVDGGGDLGPRPEVARDSTPTVEVGTTASGGHLVPPSLTADGIDDGYGNHVAYPPIGTPAARLFVLLPDAKSAPTDYDRLLRAAASAGYHAIGLAYPNAKSTAAACGSDAACYRDARLEVIDGKDRGSAATVGRANCIESRLLVLLDLLDAAWPSESWGSYLGDTSATWSTIAVGGHGDGGGYAALLASGRELSRVVMFSAPDDEVTSTPVPWVTGPHTTAAARYFGLSHASEPGHDAHLRAWMALGLDATHQVTTAVSPASGPSGTDPSHGATALDAYTPLDASKNPVLTSVWNGLLGP